MYLYIYVKELASKRMKQVSYYRVPLRQILSPSSGLFVFTKHNLFLRNTIIFFLYSEFKVEWKWGRLPVWYDMESNLALNKYSDHVFPGSLLVGLNAGPIGDGDGDDFEDVLPKLSQNVVSNMKHKANVIVQIFECQRLPQLDPNGYSDPYIKAIIGEESTSTKITDDAGNKNKRYQMRKLIKFQN